MDALLGGASSGAIFLKWMHNPTKSVGNDLISWNPFIGVLTYAQEEFYVSDADDRWNSLNELILYDDITTDILRTLLDLPLLTRV